MSFQQPTTDADWIAQPARPIGTGWWTVGEPGVMVGVEAEADQLDVIMGARNAPVGRERLSANDVTGALDTATRAVGRGIRNLFDPDRDPNAKPSGFDLPWYAWVGLGLGALVMFKK